MPDFSAHLLSIVTFAPLATALALLAARGVARLLGLPILPAGAWRVAGLLGSLFTFVLSLRLFAGFDLAEPSFQFVEHAEWLPSWGIDYFVGIDGIALFLVLLTTFLMPVVLVASWNEVERSLESWVFFMLLLETGMLGAFVSLNLIQFYLFWEVMLIPMYFIIGIWGGPRRVYAAVKFFLFTMFGSFPLLVAILVLAALPLAETGVLVFNLVAPPGASGPALLDLPVPTDDPVWWKNQVWLFGAFSLAFAIKVPVVPLHTWLPDAHVEAPTAGSVVLAGVLLKMGAYGFLRFALPLFPDAAQAYTPLLLCLAVIGIVYGSLLAMVQADLKKLVAYSSVAHLGFVMLGTFSLNTNGLNGAVLQMLNHGLSTGALFLLVGMLYGRRHTRLLSEFGGVARPMPVYAACFGLVIMSSIGLPGLNGFVGEFLILVGTYLAHPTIAIIATSGVVLVAAYMLWMFRRVMFGPIENPENRGLIDLGLREKLVMVALLLPIVGIGVYPDPCLRRIEPSVVELLRLVEVRRQVSPLVEAEPEADVPIDVPPEQLEDGEAL
ncbi:MAG: NADH-quinone oxidoreductase subunit M [Deltaproteobacteria bacterium]|nr:NADH-quinone oxidoreductase subunit M [Deltaproteobacteria bacterium]MBW2360704.1 NADH-quinone oxidoreductase subunit M [Deltaproteobacteria bacterium]